MLNRIVSTWTIIFFLSFVQINTESTNCNRTYTDANGSISSPNFPFNYANNMLCTYTILPPQDLQYTYLCFLFFRFSLETNSPYCTFDSLSIRTAGSFFKYCGRGVWNYGKEDPDNAMWNLWNPSFCWRTNPGERFELTFFSDDSIVSTGFLFHYTVSNSSISHQPLYSQAPCGANEWTCFNRKCVNLTHQCDGTNDCFDQSDESYAHSRCAAKENIFACDFSTNQSRKSFCDFAIDGWQLGGLYASNKTNLPKILDHTTNSENGSYIYVSQKSAQLTTSEMNLCNNCSHCLTFWYLVSSEAQTTLSVFTQTRSPQAEWTRRIRGSPGPVWVRGDVPVEDGSNVRIVFRVETVRGVLALDDISLSPAKCQLIDISCQFSSTMCVWNSNQSFESLSQPLIPSATWMLDKESAFIYSTSTSASLTTAILSTRLDQSDNHCLSISYSIVTTRNVQVSRDVNCSIAVYVINGAAASVVGFVAMGTRGWRDINIQYSAQPGQMVAVVGKLSEMCSIMVGGIQENYQCSSFSTTDTCLVSEYRCRNENCILIEQLCLNISRCSDGSDERYYKISCGSPSIFSIGTMGMQTVTPNLASPTSSSSTSSSSSPPDASTCFRCSANLCIGRQLVCNQLFDCPGGEDEINCRGSTATSIPTTAIECAENEQLCRGVCMEASQTCGAKPACENIPCSGSQIALKLDSGAIAGIVVACVACIIIFFICILCLAMRFCRSQKCNSLQSSRSFSAFFKTEVAGSNPEKEVKKVTSKSRSQNIPAINTVVRSPSTKNVPIFRTYSNAAKLHNSSANSSSEDPNARSLPPVPTVLPLVTLDDYMLRSQGEMSNPSISTADHIYEEPQRLNFVVASSYSDLDSHSSSFSYLSPTIHSRATSYNAPVSQTSPQWPRVDAFHYLMNNRGEIITKERQPNADAAGWQGQSKTMAFHPAMMTSSNSSGQGLLLSHAPGDELRATCV